MADLTSHLCEICGVPATHYRSPPSLHRDAVGEIVSDRQAELDGHYYCERHVPHLHIEPLEDRLD